ncbi:MAG: FG-GAP-like repeat-containing protein [Bacteroidota bacterium]
MKVFSRNLFLIFSIIFFVSLKMDTLSVYTIPPSAQSVCTGDLDLDGFNDIIVGHNYNDVYNFGGVSILRNQGLGNFVLTDSIYAIANEWAVATAQLDSDPHPELLFLRENSITHFEYVEIVFNNVMIDTMLLNDAQPGFAIDYLATGDIDGNGFKDIVFASNQGLFWGIFYNYGNRNFSAPEIHQVTTFYPSGLAVGDLNNDGRDDIVLCGQLIDIYFSYPSGFQNLQLSADGFAGGVSITDFDQDGYNDILANSGLGSTVLVKYKNNWNNTFQKLPDFIFQPACGEFFLTDLNNDGLTDVIYQNRSNTGYVLWYNQGNFQLADSSFISVPCLGEPSRSFYCTDLDNNGFNDIITVRFDAYYLINNIDIRFNDGQGHFIPDPVVGVKNYSYIISFGLKNYPNPFQDETIFNFILKETSLVDLSVFDLQGKFVTCLTNQKLKGGQQMIKWRGLDNGGQPCKPSAFVVYLKVNGKICQAIKVIKT